MAPTRGEDSLSGLSQKSASSDLGGPCPKCLPWMRGAGEESSQRIPTIGSVTIVSITPHRQTNSAISRGDRYLRKYDLSLERYGLGIELTLVYE